LKLPHLHKVALGIKCSIQELNGSTFKPQQRLSGQDFPPSTVILLSVSEAAGITGVLHHTWLGWYIFRSTAVHLFHCSDPLLLIHFGKHPFRILENISSWGNSKEV
jgi:hypothetical protein